MPLTSLRLLLITASLTLLSLGGYAALPTSDSEGEPLPTLAPMLKQVIPGVVNIVTTTHVTIQSNSLLADPFFRRFFDLPPQQRQTKRKSQSLGSGVVVDANRGLVLTNNHVIAEADEIAVNLANGETVPATLIGRDAETDIALLQVKYSKLRALSWADSDLLQVGDFVVAIGNPFGLGQTVTSGIISALGRSGLGIEGYEDFIQTDASINPGNSGGALVNLRGELVGINTAILSKSGGNVGIGFAIPSNMVQAVMDHLLQYGKVDRGVVGITAQDIDHSLAEAFNLKDRYGAVITEIVPGSPADMAQLEIGDIITHIDGKRVERAGDIRTRIGLLRVGTTTMIQILRRNKALQIQLTVAQSGPARVQGKRLHPNLEGAELIEVVKEGYRGQIALVVIASIKTGSAAAEAGLQQGDIIIEANRQAIANLKDLNTALKNGHSLLLNIQRGSRAFYLLIR